MANGEEREHVTLIDGRAAAPAGSHPTAGSAGAKPLMLGKCHRLDLYMCISQSVCAGMCFSAEPMIKHVVGRFAGPSRPARVSQKHNLIRLAQLPDRPQVARPHQVLVLEPILAIQR